jgi:Rieske [2Fe-2S] domain
MSMFVKVAKTHELAEGGMVAVLVGDIEILLAQVQGQYYAISNVCTHAGRAVRCYALRTEGIGNPGGHLPLRVRIDANMMHQGLNDLALRGLIIALVNVVQSLLKAFQ